MTVATIKDVEFGEQLPVFDPDTSLDNVKKFAAAAHWFGPRFTDHEAARKEGLPGALVPLLLPDDAQNGQLFEAQELRDWAQE